jgi:hypothetical protein
VLLAKLLDPPNHVQNKTDMYAKCSRVAAARLEADGKTEQLEVHRIWIHSCATGCRFWPPSSLPSSLHSWLHKNCSAA